MEIRFTRPTGEAAIIFVDASVSETHLTSALVSDHPVESGTDISDNVRAQNDQLTIELVISNDPTLQPTSHADGVTMIKAAVVLSTNRDRLKRRTQGNPRQIVQSIPPSSVRDAAAPLGVAASFAAGQGIGSAVTGIALTAVGSVRIPGMTPVFAERPLAVVPDSEQGATLLEFSKPFDRVRAVYEELVAIVKHGTTVTISTSLRDYENMAIVAMSTPRDVDNANVLRVTIDAKQLRVVSTQIVQVTAPVQTMGHKNVKKGNQPAADVVPGTPIDNRTDWKKQLDEEEAESNRVRMGE